MAITLSEAERAELLRRTEVPHRRSAKKARIILACADGMSNAAVARLVGIQAKTVGKWRRAFAAERMAGLEDAGRIGRPKADPILDETERRQLQQWARRAKTAQFLALRARIVLRCPSSTGQTLPDAARVALDGEDSYARAYCIEVSAGGGEWETVWSMEAGDGGLETARFAPWAVYGA
ncbi:helix-turn-helix domain-containing protein (plasmid) [Streptomyces sp. CA-294286]|uniref:helix-turn-helix domain-containing protein n=1 Tax=Streptomyces sp. CA-294286 TaxID=3240070 RepID=UPI003D924847